MTATPFTLTATDGCALRGSLYRTPKPRLGVVVINAAAGVRRRYYDDFAGFLAEQGFDVLTWDARGIGESAVLPARADRSRMADWGRYDLEGVLRHVFRHIEPDSRRVAVIGHSAGGNLAGLAPSLPQIGGLCLIASGTRYWRLYRKREWPRMLLAWHVLMPVFLRVFGYLPAKLGIGHDLPPAVAGDWRNWSLQPDYLFSDPTLKLDAYAQFNRPLLALAVADDVGFAPPRAVDALLARFSAARIDRRVLHPAAAGLRRIGHFGFFQRRQSALWPPVQAWLEATLRAGGRADASRKPCHPASARLAAD
jgi:predicted alpha/beta hydrolase